MTMDPVYMTCYQMVDLACGVDTDPHLKQSMLHCFLNILLEKLNLNSKCVALQPNQGNPVYDIFLYKLKSCEIKIINLSEFKPVNELEKKKSNQTAVVEKPCIQTVAVANESKSKRKCICTSDSSDLLLKELDSECVGELMERIRIQEFELEQLTERLDKFILQFHRKLPRKSKEIRDPIKDGLRKALQCNCVKKKSQCGVDKCNNCCAAQSSTSSDADVECKVNDHTNKNNDKMIILTQVPILPPLQASPLRKIMGKKAEPPRCCGGPHTTIQPNDRLFKSSNLGDQFGKDKEPEQISFGTGVDGKMYRCDPPPPVCTCRENLLSGNKFPCSEHKSDIPPGKKKLLTSPKKCDNPPPTFCTCRENLLSGNKFPCSEHKSDKKPLTSPKKDDNIQLRKKDDKDKRVK